MSDMSQGEGWWQASDGKWYPPETHPNFGGGTVQPGPAPDAEVAKPNLWRRFRSLALWKQVVAWVVAVFIIIFVIAGVAGGGNNKKNVSTASPTTPVTTGKATTTTTVARTVAPTTVPPTTAPTTAPPITLAPTTPLTTAAPAAPTPTGPGGCHPLTNAGGCYEAGEFCRASDHGASGIAGDGKPITCRNNNGWRWEPS
jgi:hypothetical protein